MDADPIELFFFFNDTATTEIYTLSLHDALPISAQVHGVCSPARRMAIRPRPRCLHLRRQREQRDLVRGADRKSTRLNSSHANISYAVFCLKKKKHQNLTIRFTC